jgi:molecular chaperone DnaK (HSP70)
VTPDVRTRSSRFVIGIDLGTTNSAVAWADLHEAEGGEPLRVRRFPIPQLVGPGETAASDTLPSFLYLAPPEEREAERLAQPWANGDAPVVGHWARERGMQVPGRLVSSAKSWLSHDAVDRRAKLLPWSGDPTERQLSPIEVSAAYLRHIRESWNHAHGHAVGTRFEDQEIVLTVPASFDEEARELTIEAARSAGYRHFTLIEEPAAALYAWIAAHPGTLDRQLSHGQRVLVCDVGGGTTDFTLVEVRVVDGEVSFERVRVGEHLLLGGDNVDLGLARLVEEKLGMPRLSLTQQQALRRQCAVVKERLLGPPASKAADVTVLGSGRSVVGGALTTTMAREEVLELAMNGFLPVVEATAAPAVNRRAGLRELGLPYAADPGITRHLAAFLRGDEERPVRPDLVLFNGGFFTPDELRGRVEDVLASWFEANDLGWAPRVLVNQSPATAVADGAAYFGLVRHGHGMRIGGGSPRSYYIGLRRAESTEAGDGSPGDAEIQAVCILPHGTEEGATLDLTDRKFFVSSNQVIAFTLWSSRTRRDAAGAVVTVPESTLHRHAPLVTELRFGKRSRSVEVPVQVEARYTELGTLAVTLVSRETSHRWRLEFQLRGPVRQADSGPEAKRDAAPAPALARAVSLVRDLFGPATTSETTPETLMAALEAALGAGRHGWSLGDIRTICDALLETAAGRMKSARHEARFLNLLGFCLRPGFGATRDATRLAQARKIYMAGLAFPSEVQGQSEWLVLWQRVAPGLAPTQQLEMFQRYAAAIGLHGKTAKRLHPQVERETWRLLASLEQIAPDLRARVGDALVARLKKDRNNASLLWALSRAGARVPFHGPLNNVVPADHAASWMRLLLERHTLSEDAAVTLAQLGAFTADAARDVPEDLRQEAATRLAAENHPSRLASRLLEPTGPARADAERLFGESLPEGLRLEDV